MDSPQSKTDWLKTISALGIVLGLIFGGFTFAYNEWYDVPKLTYESLTSYPLSSGETIIPIIIRNEGREKATGVRITIYTSGEIQSVQQKTPEELKLKVENNMLIANLDRMVDKSQITFYLRVKTLSQAPIDDILIASDQGSGSIHERERTTTNTNQFYFSTIIIILMTLIFATYTFRIRQIKIGGETEGLHSGEQNLIFAYLCDIHGLNEEASVYRKKDYGIQYWSEADGIRQIVQGNPSSENTDKWKSVLSDLLDYARVTKDSRGIIQYNLACIEHLQGNKEDAHKYLEKAKEYSKDIVEERLKIDPMFKTEI